MTPTYVVKQRLQLIRSQTNDVKVHCIIRHIYKN